MIKDMETLGVHLLGGYAAARAVGSVLRQCARG